MIHEIIINGRDNTFTLQFSGVTLPNPTRIEFTLNGVTVNSVDNPEYFISTLNTDGKIAFKLGAAGYTAGYEGVATVAVFDAVNINGVEYLSDCTTTRLFVTVC